VTVDEAELLGRFGALVRTAPVPLGEAALVVAAVLGHPQPVAKGVDRLAELADAVPGTAPDLADVTRHLFATVGLRGDRTSYYSPDNSLLPAVLERGRGIPVTLAIVAADVARRRGLPAVVVGMPGHVLLGDGDPPARWCDVFNGGDWLDALGARARFASIHGRHAPFDPRFLGASSDPAVLARLLANLVGIYHAAGDGHGLVRTLLLRAQIPGVARSERPQLAAALTAVGRFQEAAEVWQTEAGGGPGARATAAGAEAARLRARLN
jgi:regulator of sirC expression with transglutaminase-like and TPR domain